tara:strand:+ start:3908 stop:4834 length:927 start_codon:yes stop_codon:yes gene_type:complete
MKFKKPNFWKDINLISILLLPFSLVTVLFNSFKSFLITGSKFNIPIICVGNIYIGGTGKTPLSVNIYNMLKKKRYKPAIVRKYYSSHFDEIYLTRNKVKQFFSDKKRKLSISKAIKKKNNVIVMDDGFQDLSIKKNFNIICFNSLDLVGNGLLLPAGPLRDKLKKIKDCQMVVINGKRNIGFEKKLKLISNNIKIYQSIYELKKIKKYKRKKLLAFAGIGSPENFFNLLKSYKLNVKDKISFPDHYNYTKNEIKRIILRAKKKNLKPVTTEKDYFRIKKFGIKSIDYVPVNLKINKYKSFKQEILKNL